MLNTTKTNQIEPFDVVCQTSDEWQTIIDYFD